jgi:polar amino acid transport system substrate-binding protein
MRTPFCRIMFAILVAGLFFPAFALADNTFVLASREKTLINRFAEGVLTEAYSRLNITVTLKLFPGALSVIEANEGRADGEVARLAAVLKQYTNLILIPVPLLHSNLSVFMHKDSPIVITDWASLKGHKLSTINGFKFVKNKMAGQSPVIVETTTEAIRLVEQNRVDIAVLNRLLGVLAIAEIKAKEVKVHNPPLAQLPVYHMVHKKHEDLVPKLTATLQDMVREGVIQRMWEDFTKREVKRAYSLGDNEQKN